MYWVYVLQSVLDKSYYVGFTENLDDRLEYHNKGSVDSTKNKRPWKRIWCGCFENKSKALMFEKYLKTGSGIAFRNKRLI